jgi:hypothetical protein
MEKNNQVVEAKMKVPRILCEIFVYGTEDEKPKLKNLLDDLQIQMNKARRNRNKLRVCFYIDKGELSVQEKLEWFSKEGKCKYFKVLNADSKIDKNFIRDVLGKIRNFENSLSSLKKSNIKILGLKEKKEDEIEEAKILDINL